MYLFHALAGCVAGGHILTPTRIYVFCHGQFILAVALGVVRKHTSKKKPTHYKLLVNHAASASTSLMMAAAALGFPNAWPATIKKHLNVMLLTMPKL
jgi:hypothetical protein